MRLLFIGAICILAAGTIIFLIFGKWRGGREPNLPQSLPMANTFILKSAAFKDNDFIPAQYTCEGENVNPLLEILNAPEGTQSLALIMEDPDAPRGTWDHWILWNIDPRTHYILQDTVPMRAVQGKTSFGALRYGGPCPPRGDKPHRYLFKVYALDVILDLPEGAEKAELEKALVGHIRGETTLTGLYQRK